MSELSVKDVNADLSLLVDRFINSDRMIPSFSEIAKRGLFVPFISVVLSLISVVLFYFTLMAERTISLPGFRDFFMEEGWYPIAATLFTGFCFFVMSYTNLMLYVAIPNDARNKSIVIRHLKGIIKKTVSCFIVLVSLSAFLTAFEPVFAFVIPGLMFMFVFVINIVVSAEINRLGMGFAIEKIGKLIKKI